MPMYRIHLCKPWLAWKLLALSVLLTGCLFSSGGEQEKTRPATLGETSLVGAYSLVDYLIEYGDGQKYTPDIINLTGTLSMTPDSVYLERIWVATTPTPSDTKGKITKVELIGSGNAKGFITMTLDQVDSTQTSSGAFFFRADTLVLIIVVSKERDALKKGYKQTAFWLPDSIPKL
jgi:hypothetical protein